MSYYYNYNFPATVLRLFIVYGPGQKENRLIPFVITNCLKDNNFKVSKGEQIRDFCFIDDIIDAILLTLNNKKTFGKIINIASGKQVAVKRIINKLNQKIKKGTPIFGKLENKLENKTLFANNQVAKSILKWKPKYSLNQGLNKTIKYYEQLG